MSIRKWLLAAGTRAGAADGGFPAGAVTLRYANQGDLKSLDP